MTQNRHQEASLGSYAGAIRRHPWLIVMAMLAALAGSLALLAIQESTYRASARILIDPASADDEDLIGLPLVRDAGDPTRTAQTAAALLESPSAASATAAQLGRPWTTRSVLDAVSIEPAGQSNILTVTGTADSPQEAARLANAFSAATLAKRDAELIAAVRDQQPSTQAPSAARAARLETLSRLGDPTVSLADNALPPVAASGAPWWAIVVLALGAGAVIGAVAAIVVDMRSPRRLSDEEELLRLMPEPILARLPERWYPFGGETGAGDLTPADVGFRSLEVQLGLLDGRARTVIITSPGQDDGKTSLVAGLALRLASEEQRVVLLDLDLHAPELAERLGVSADRGLADALALGGSLESALTSVPEVPGLEIVRGMKDPRLAALAATRQRLPALIAEARASGRHVLIDTAPLGTVSDAILLLDGIDELVIVARVGHTELAAIEGARDALRRAARTPSGLVIVSSGAARYPEVGGLLPPASDPRIRDEGELAALISAPVLARIPAMPQVSRLGDSGTRRQDESFRHAMRLLAASVQGLNRQGERVVIAVTSPMAGDGKTMVVAWLSQALAVTGSRVVAADCDLRSPTLHTYFDARARVGGGLPNLRMMRLGDHVAFPSRAPALSERVGRDRMSALFDPLRDQADYVVVDTSPVSSVAHASTVAAAADAVILVVDWQRIRRRDLLAARDRLTDAGGRIVGIVLNRAPADAAAHAFEDDHPAPSETPQPHL